MVTQSIFDGRLNGTSSELKMKVDILGSQISVWNLDETVSAVIDLAKRSQKAGDKHYVCISNVHTVVTGFQNPDYAAVTNGATIATADGVPLIWASKLFHKSRGSNVIHGRASGPNIMARVFEQDDTFRHYFYGSTQDVLDELKKNLSTKFPKLQCAGFFSPPFRQAQTPQTPLTNEEIEDCKRINESNADIVWVGLGAPKQEIWMYRARKHLTAPVLVGVGAAFDFLAGNKKRAPQWMQKAGLEWSYRMIQEPKRLASRYMKTNPVFLAQVFKEFLKTSLR
ncbi:MAG: WecB/TagA/CpsF family glycosyltransferase [Bacteriovoracia bacterium]